MLPGFAKVTVERLRGVPTADGHGNMPLDWASPAVLTIERCWIGQPGGVELSTGQQTTITEQHWWGPADADVMSADRIKDVELGVTYVVDGPVLFERDPVGPYSHKTCLLKAVSG
jgi:hypothetical protein